MCFFHVSFSVLFAKSYIFSFAKTLHNISCFQFYHRDETRFFFFSHQELFLHMWGMRSGMGAVSGVQRDQV